jgi:polysaccharide export outer membrane protein
MGLLAQPPETLPPVYELGADDVITIWALGAEEIPATPVRIDPNGFVDLPLVGRLRAAGQSVEQLKAELARRLREYVQEPQVAVSVVEFRSQPVSVLGAVKNPGVHQLQGRKTLVEVLSLAGGLGPEAGHSIKITRRLEWGRIPLPRAADDATERFSVAEVSVRSVLEARRPEENILIRPHDILSVPRAEMVYVMGSVNKAGGFVLQERETLSVLEALSLAGGVTRTAAPRQARILRPVAGQHSRAELPLDLQRILDGKGKDVPLAADDILFVPTSAAKSAGLRAVEAAIQLGVGVVIWRR